MPRGHLSPRRSFRFHLPNERSSLGFPSDRPRQARTCRPRRPDLLPEWWAVGRARPRWPAPPRAGNAVELAPRATSKFRAEADTTPALRIPDGSWVTPATTRASAPRARRLDATDPGPEGSSCTRFSFPSASKAPKSSTPGGPTGAASAVRRVGCRTLLQSWLWPGHEPDPKDLRIVTTNTIAATTWRGTSANVAVVETPGCWAWVAPRRLSGAARLTMSTPIATIVKRRTASAGQRWAMTANTTPPIQVNAKVKTATPA